MKKRTKIKDVDVSRLGVQLGARVPKPGSRLKGAEKGPKKATGKPAADAGGRAADPDRGHRP